MSAAVVTMHSDDWQDLADVVVPNAKAYCDKQKCDLGVLLIPATYDFHKIKLILRWLETGADLVFYMDIDTFITNHNIRLESFIDDSHDFYIAQDINEVNAGVLLVKRSDWSIEFLKFILNMSGSYSNEQNVIELQKDHPKIKILPHPSINSYPYDEYAPNWGLIPGRIPTTGTMCRPTHEQGDWQQGDFLMHLPGLPNRRRIEIFKSL